MKNSELNVRRILIVDDDELNSRAIAKRLERRGFSVLHITSGEHLLETIDHHEIEIVLMDIVMPNTDGISLLKNLRKVHDQSTLPVIMVTSLDDSSDIIDSFQFGANDYITKPLNIDVATARVKAHLALVDIQKSSTNKIELATVQAMVATYNHENNNPLAIACAGMLSLERKSKDIDVKSLKRVKEAHRRLTEIVRRIEESSKKNKIDFESYTDVSKMVSLKK